MTMFPEVCHTIARNKIFGAGHIDRPEIVSRVFSIGHLELSAGNEHGEESLT